MRANTEPENAELPNGPVARALSGDGTTGIPKRPSTTSSAKTAEARPNKTSCRQRSIASPLNCNPAQKAMNHTTIETTPDDRVKPPKMLIKGASLANDAISPVAIATPSNNMVLSTKSDPRLTAIARVAVANNPININPRSGNAANPQGLKKHKASTPIAGAYWLMRFIEIYLKDTLLGDVQAYADTSTSR